MSNSLTHTQSQPGVVSHFLYIRDVVPLYYTYTDWICQVLVFFSTFYIYQKCYVALSDW